VGKCWLAFFCFFVGENCWWSECVIASCCFFWIFQLYFFLPLPLRLPLFFA
jgi:hypothetical protein